MTTIGGEDLAIYNEGTFPYESAETKIRERNLAFTERRFQAAQLNGKHILPFLNKAQLTWMSSLSRMDQNEPDLRFFIDIDRTGTGNNWEIKSNERPVRYFRSMYENNLDNRVDLQIPLTVWKMKSKVKVGGFFTYKNRDLQENKFDHNVQNAASHTGVVFALPRSNRYTRFNLQRCFIL